MGYVLRRIEERKNSLNLLRSIVKNPETTLVIHYSCESLFDRGDGSSPRINSISVKFLGSGQQRSFSINQLAEREKVPMDKISSNYAKLERMLLDEFYKFVDKYKDFKWVHWSMNFNNIGFPALAHRYMVLGGDPISIPDTNLIDLSAILKKIYGQNYISRPPLYNLINKNDLQTQQLLTGKEEAFAIEAGKYFEASQSTESKIYILSKILYKVVDGHLKTNASTIKWKILTIRALVEKFLTSNFFKILGLIGALASIVGLIYVIIKNRL